MALSSRWVFPLVTITLAAIHAHEASAGSNDVAKILIHLASTTSKNPCTPVGGVPACGQISTQGDLYPHSYFAYLMVTNGDSAAGIAGAQCGIDYEAAEQAGVDIYSWTNCATLQFPSAGWPAASTGNLVTWNSQASCQRTEPGGPGEGVAAIMGYFYLAAYSPDTLRVISRPDDQIASLADCDAKVSILQSPALMPSPPPLGYVTFSEGAGEQGYNPCLESLTQLWIMDVSWEGSAAGQHSPPPPEIRFNALTPAAEDTFPLSTMLLRNKENRKVGEAYFQQRYVRPINIRPDGTIVENPALILPASRLALTRDGTLICPLPEATRLSGHRIRTIPDAVSVTSPGNRPGGRRAGAAGGEYFDFHSDPSGDLVILQAKEATYFYETNRGVTLAFPYKSGTPTFGGDKACMVQLDKSAATRVVVAASSGVVAWSSDWHQQPSFVNDAYLFPGGEDVFFSIDRATAFVAHIADGSVRELASLPLGNGRWFSQDGKYLLIRRHELDADIMSFWSLLDLLSPELLWERACDPGRLVTRAAVSPNGEYVAFHLQQSSGVIRDLYVLDRNGSEISRKVKTRHDDDGLYFVTSTDFFEGYDPADQHGRTSQVTLYRIAGH